MHNLFGFKYTCHGVETWRISFTCSLKFPNNGNKSFCYNININFSSTLAPSSPLYPQPLPQKTKSRWRTSCWQYLRPRTCQVSHVEFRSKIGYLPHMRKANSTCKTKQNKTLWNPPTLVPILYLSCQNPSVKTSEAGWIHSNYTKSNTGTLGLLCPIKMSCNAHLPH
jgi:hypothetical protein